MFFKIFKKEKPKVTIEAIKVKEGNLDGFIDALKNKSIIVLISGKRGSGKTALAFALLEKIKNKRKIYMLGIKARLPRWIKQIDSVERIKNNSVVLIDEAAIAIGARESSKALNKAISKLMAIARHKNLSLIFITQSAAMLDINVLRLVDAFIIKEPSLLQERFERKEIKKLYEEVKQEFKKIKEGKEAYAFIFSDFFEGLIKASLPSFWNEKLSKSFAFFEVKI